MPVGAISIGVGQSGAVRSPKEAANALEALLFQQLLKSMNQSVSKSGLMGDGFQCQLYQDMFSGVLAERVAGSGSGISEMILNSFGQQDGAGKTVGVQFNRPGMGAYRKMVAGQAESPANAHLFGVAQRWIGNADAAARWGKQGRLTRADLGVDVATPVKEGVAAFNVADANGYQGFPKCNLFAFEMVHRAGYKVPLVARSHGWGFPSADATSAMVKKGVGDWATVQTQKDAETLDRLARSGQPLLLAGAGVGDKVGHMAVADRVHQVVRNDQGQIVALEYSGWEAKGTGAAYGRHMWRTPGVSGNGRGMLTDIEVLAPKRASVDAPYAMDRERLPGASVADGPTAPPLWAQEGDGNADINR